MTANKLTLYRQYTEDRVLHRRDVSNTAFLEDNGIRAGDSFDLVMRLGKSERKFYSITCEGYATTWDAPMTDLVVSFPGANMNKVVVSDWDDNVIAVSRNVENRLHMHTLGMAMLKVRMRYGLSLACVQAS